MPKRLNGLFTRRALVALICWLAPVCAEAAAVEVVSPKGLKVWLIEDHQTPVLTLGFRFAGGSAEDPPGKEGLAHMAAEMAFEGGGAFAGDAYIQQWDDLGAETNVEARLKSVRGTMRVLTPDRAKAVELLALAINAPRFDAASIDQVRERIGAEIDRDATDPEATAFLAYDRLGFGTHPRARPVAGTHQSLAKLSAADLASFRRRIGVRNRLSLAAVGDISPPELGRVVDRIFAGLPQGDTVAPIAPPPPTISARRDLAMNSSQAQVAFGISLPGLSRREQLAAELLNYTLGGSAFTSRLYHEIREKRGIAYSIGTTLDRYSFMSELSGSFGAAPGRVEEAVALVKQELQGLSARPPTDDEVSEAKAALAGEYLRGLIRQADLANEMTLRMQLGDGPGFIDAYAGQLAGISPEEVRALAQRIPWLERLVVVTVAAPGAPSEAAGDRSRSTATPAREP